LAIWSQADSVSKMVEAFQAQNPDIEVNLTVTPWKEYWQKLQAGLVGGAGPDVFWMNGPNFYKYASAGFLQDLSDAQLDKSLYPQPILDLYTYKDKLYAVPKDYDVAVLTYNKKLFDEAGLEYPNGEWTWDKWTKAMEKLTIKKDGKIEQWGMASLGDDLEPMLVYSLIFQNGGFIVNEDKTQSGFDKPEAIEALKFMNSWIEQGWIPDAQTAVDAKAQQLFMSEKVAMLTTITPRISVVYQALGDKIGVTHLPHPKDGAQDSQIHGIGWVANAKSKHKEAALRLAKFLGSEDAQIVDANTGRALPANKNVREKWASSMPGVKLDVMYEAAEYATPFPISKTSGAWFSEVYTQISNLAWGKQSPEETGKVLAEIINKHLKEE